MLILWSIFTLSFREGAGHSDATSTEATLGRSRLKDEKRPSPPKEIELEIGLEDSTQTNLREKSKEILEDAAAFTLYIESVKKEIPIEEEYTHRTLTSLQRIFFEKDWVFASWVDPSIQAEAAAEAYEIFKASNGQVNWDELINRFSNQDRSMPQNAHKLKDYYELRMNDRNPAFKEVATVLEDFVLSDETLFTSDLLSDAWSYAVLRTDMSDLWESESQGMQQLASRMNNEIADYGIELHPEDRANFENFNQYEQDFLKKSVQTTVQAYDQLFSWRFENIHGMENAQSVLDALSEVKMRYVMAKDVNLPPPLSHNPMQP